MKIIETLYNDLEFPPTVITLGYFDGIHLGHQCLIDTTKKVAAKKSIKSAVFTFKTHPLSIISPEKAPKLLFSNDKKIEIVESLGIDYMIYPDFTLDIMNEKPEEFVKNILVDKFNARHIVVGFNYKFGYKGMGTPNTLIELGKKYNFEVTIIQPIKINDQTVSSTFIRNLIENGEVELAKSYLGRPYSITGTVIPGKGLGKKISIPTANIAVEDTIVIPSYGVYYTKVSLQHHQFDAITNVGNNPTFSNHPVAIESYLFNFNKEIYGEKIEVFFLKKVRSEMKFNSIEELVSQMKKDMKFVKESLIS